MLGAILCAHEEIKKIVAFLSEIEAEVGKEKMEAIVYHPDEELAAKVRTFAFDKVVWSLDTFDRSEREVRGEQVKKQTVEAFKEEYPESAKDIGAILYTLTKEVVRDKIINKKVRPDGRAQDEIRPIWSEVGIFGRTHGSADLQRGAYHCRNRSIQRLSGGR